MKGQLKAEARKRNGPPPASDPSTLNEYAWHEDNSGKRTHTVGTKKPNNLEIYDMTGNVFEWCQDIFRVDWYKESEKDNPRRPVKGPERLMRGWCWYSAVGYNRTAYRFGISPDHRNSNFGFRLVLPENPVTLPAESLNRQN